MNVLYAAEALAFLDRTHDDPTLGERLDAALDDFEADPTQARWRARAYAGITPRAFAFDVRGRHDDVMVLWQQVSTPGKADHVFVPYIGPLFGA